MKFLQNLALVAGVANFADAINLRRSVSPSVVGAPIKRRHVQNPSLRDRRRRDDLHTRATSKSVNVDITNGETLYVINVTLGTPPQSLSLHLDTGSSDLWTNVPGSSLCNSNQFSQYCSEFGTFDSSKSSSYKVVNDLFNITYADGSGATGDYATDVFTMGSVKLNSQQFGVGTKSSSPEGILGVGYATDEALTVSDNGQTYSNVPKSLQASGYTNTIAYSLWLNDLNSAEGTILFGGVDTDKYQGSLETFPVLESNGAYTQLAIALSGIGLNGGSITSVDGLPALFDSGTSLTYLPEEIANSIIQEFNGQYNQELGAPVVDCGLADQTGSVEYKFSDSLTISVPLSELVEVGAEEGGQETCILGVAPISDAPYAILGDTFLRNAYVVYDLTNNEISLAATDFNATSSNVMEITSSGVPDAKGASAAATTATGLPSGAIEVTGTGVGGSAATRTSKGGAATPPPARAYGALAAAGLGAILAL